MFSGNELVFSRSFPIFFLVIPFINCFQPKQNLHVYCQNKFKTKSFSINLNSHYESAPGS